jgi:hypothetical protein
MVFAETVPFWNGRADLIGTGRALRYVSFLSTDEDDVVRHDA